MADKTNALATAQPNNPRFQTGTKTRVVEFSASVTAANSAIGDKFILASGLSYDDRISAIRPGRAGTPALTSASDNDLGFFYKNQNGNFVEIDKDILWDGVTLASALTHPNLLTALNTSLDLSKNIGQLVSKGADQVPAGGIYLILTTNVANTATGPLVFEVSIEIDEATTN